MPIATELQVHRFEVSPQPHAGDPVGQAAMRDAARIGLAPAAIRTSRVYLIEAALDHQQAHRLLESLLVDSVIEEGFIGASSPEPGVSVIEIHPLPGVMDPAAQSVEEAVQSLLGVEASVSTGRRYEIVGLSEAEARELARRVLANPVVHAIHSEAFSPTRLPKGHEAPFELRHVAIQNLDDAALEKLSREAHLFLSLEEMQAIRAEYRKLEREPTDIELETLAQTWSEHCVHKTLKSTIRYREQTERETNAQTKSHDPIAWQGRPGHELHSDGSVTIHNLLKSTVAAATNELIAEGVDWTLSVFIDNAGVVAFDDQHAVCVKVETHNHPSAIEPYGGAATGIGGCIRDIMGTGLAARPIASTNVFCVATPDLKELPTGCLHPQRILKDVVAGVRDYGNRMGIPTVNGAVYFNDRFVGNPLVFCGCIGVMPRNRIKGEAKPGDLIVALGGRTGRDGIHGATFSSSELTNTHVDEFAHAVQIGNAIEQKRVLDAILRARDDLVQGSASTPTNQVPKSKCLFSAITDCGAGGFSSAVGEMGEKLGAEVHLDRAPLKYTGLTYTEIWISEAQERMVLAVPAENLDALQAICDEERVELSVLGTFGTPNQELVLRFRGQEVGRLPMKFLHEGIPTPTREAVWNQSERRTQGPAEVAKAQRGTSASPPDAQSALLRLLAEPNIASKHWIIRQYDHEVLGNTVVRPLGGAAGRGPMDGAVVQPVPGSKQGLAIACGLGVTTEGDPYETALAAIDECVRNLVCIGADPDRIAILDNFCWPSCKKPENLASLVRAAEGCYDGAKTYRTPFVSGKDSLNNQFTTDDGRTIEILPTLLITGIGIVEDVQRCVTSDAKQPGSRIVLVQPKSASEATAALLPARAAVARFIAKTIRANRVLAAHDVSDGGALCALAEMLIGGSTHDRPLGAVTDIGLEDAFSEAPGCYLLEIADDAEGVIADAAEHGSVSVAVIAKTNDSGRLTAPDVDVSVEELAAAWLGTLDW